MDDSVSLQEIGALKFPNAPKISRRGSVRMYSRSAELLLCSRNS